MTAQFVRILAESDGRSLEMVAPTERAEEALWSLARELDNTFTFTASPWPDLDLRRAS